jgi:hypothetical protein
MSESMAIKILKFLLAYEKLANLISLWAFPVSFSLMCFSWWTYHISVISWILSLNFILDLVRLSKIIIRYNRTLG